MATHTPSVNSDAVGSWQSLTPINSWVDYGGGAGEWDGFACIKDQYGTVRMRGLLKNGTTTGGTDITTLPSGYRPDEDHLIFSCRSNSTDWGVRVYNTGVVDIDSVGIPSSSWISFADIVFKTSNSSNDETHTPDLGEDSNTGWTQLESGDFSNSWTNYSDANYGPSFYRKTGNGEVMMKGLVSSGTVTAGTTMFTLPAGYRPAYPLIGVGHCNGGYWEYRINTDGEVYTGGVVPTNSWVSTANIRFMASDTSGDETHTPAVNEDGNEDWTAPTLGNSWVDTGSGWEPAGYRKLANGLVVLRGLISSGTTASGTTLFTLPTDYRPDISVPFQQATFNGTTGTDVRVRASGEVQIAGTATSSTWVSLQGISFLAE